MFNLLMQLGTDRLHWKLYDFDYGKLGKRFHICDIPMSHLLRRMLRVKFI
ncbi:hypothetical protein [Paenibacillus sp. Soil787]|nr:hypothetical protein [Paenibacillus sp. Soil787]